MVQILKASSNAALTSLCLFSGCCPISPYFFFFSSLNTHNLQPDVGTGGTAEDKRTFVSPGVALFLPSDR